MASGGFNVQPIGAGFRDNRPIVTRDTDTRHADAFAMAPRVPWDRFIERFDWRQGEHVGLIGPTGQGKTSLLLALLPLRTYVTVFATKPRDESMDRLIRQGYLRMDNWSAIPPERAPRRVLWPDATGINSDENQEKVFRSAFNQIYREGNWTLVLDEGYFVGDFLNLKKPMKMIWTQGRALGISFVVATQRPAWVPMEMYDGSTHMFFWRFGSANDVQRISSMGAAPADAVRILVNNLERYQCLYVNTRTGEMMRTRAPAPS